MKVSIPFTAVPSLKRIEQRACLHSGVTVCKLDDIGNPSLILVRRKGRMPSPIGLCHGTELVSDSTSQLFRQKPPGPIAVSNRWFVHLGFMPEAQNILHGEDCRICHRHHGKPDELPVDFLGMDDSSHIPEEPLFVLKPCLLPSHFPGLSPSNLVRYILSKEVS